MKVHLLFHSVIHILHSQIRPVLLTVVDFIVISDQLIPQFCKPQSGQVNKMSKRHIEGNFTYPSESIPISARCLSKTASNPNNLMREELEQRIPSFIKQYSNNTQCQTTASCTTQNTLIIHFT